MALQHALGTEFWNILFGGSLSDQQAIDVAEYFSHMGRPDFAGKDKDWPNGGKPKDARN